MWHAIPYFGIPATLVPPPPYEESKVIEMLEGSQYADYLCGKPIKMDFSTDVVDPMYYERCAEDGTVAGIVARLREKIVTS